ncbi:GLPGLI family protein [Siphonobacter sp. SORGH_AS_0500]|uniref:GLPGLI family protein n=1 Tax=Siphonobacter sp. SORGH_AS_0500 TaxID=1864824 RepID=UPI00285EE10B|nr:GLPGLI family protein [Siphonobacter sp. SORGH_AS_0500]MDR6192981.1 GLPGLI family protein [Siphonobacter sp. SORGH_AS_0500]
MKKKLLVVFGWLMVMCTYAQAQELEGTVTYERNTSYTKMVAKLPYLSQEEKDRAKMMWGNEEGDKQKMKLTFTPDQSLYTYIGEQGETDDGRWSWRQSDYVIQRNFEKQTLTELQEFAGKTYIIQDSLKAPKWKVLNQLKDIAGHICMKAETEDLVKNQKIIAWFADDIPVSVGPERMYGLPGIILELDYNDGVSVITATKVEMKKVDPKELALPKMKGKKINMADHDRIIKEHIKDSIGARRNPYWGVNLWN